MPNLTPANPQTPELPAADAPIERIEDAVRQQSEVIRRAYGNILKQLFHLFTRQEEIQAANPGQFLDGRSGKFSFSAYLVERFGYSPSTASQYHGILKMVEAHQAAAALEERAEVKVLRQILALPSEATKAKMLDHLSEITRENFEEWLERLSPKTGPRPHLSGLKGLSGLKKKINPQKQTLTLKGDLAHLEKVDRLLDRLTDADLERLLAEGGEG